MAKAFDPIRCRATLRRPASPANATWGFLRLPPGASAALPSRGMVAVDVAIGAVERAVREVGGALLVTADHGNLELMRDPETGQPHTAHTVGPVPLVYVGARTATLRAGGALRDIAPTLLDLLGLPQPAAMTGQSLLQPA